MILKTQKYDYPLTFESCRSIIYKHGRSKEVYKFPLRGNKRKSGGLHREYN